MQTPGSYDIRPTSDRTRGALFNILMYGKPLIAGFSLQGCRALDVFAGTGSVGLEALSRGAAHVSFIEISKKNIAILCNNINSLCNGHGTTVIHGDALKPPTPVKACGLIYLDPPYGRDLWIPALTNLSNSGWMVKGAICCIELGRHEHFSIPLNFVLLEKRHYGATQIVFLIWLGESDRS